MNNKRPAFTFPLPRTTGRIDALFSKSASYWEAKGRRMALALYDFSRTHVPAYKAHLEARGVDSSRSLSSIHEYRQLPTVTKDDYLRRHPYGDLFPPLGLHAASTISATSGSTGEPFFFPRGGEHDNFYQRSMEILLTRQWEVGKRSTLVLIGFAHGIWIGGIFTYKTLNRLAENSLPMTLVPVGANKDLYLKTFRQFAPLYDQVIVMGYPPFLKDMLEAGVEEGIQWTNSRLRILTAAEGYSERFRNHLSEITGADPIRDIVNIYGTVEQGTIANETAIANLIRRIAVERQDVFSSLFPGAQNIPTLGQYYPDHVYFEEEKGKIIATGYGSAIPLIRYEFNDLGGVIPYKEMIRKLEALGINLEHEARKHGIENMVMPLPFVYVHARADFAIVFRGANIYPDEIRYALDNPVLQKWLTGRFAILREESNTLDPVLKIHVEMREGCEWSDDIESRIRDHIMHDLCSRNSEYAYLHGAERDKVIPSIQGHPYGDSEYFGRDGKQRWVH